MTLRSSWGALLDSKANGRPGPLVPLLLFALVFLAYLPSLTGEFVWDDHGHIRQNMSLRDWAGLRTIWFTFENIDYWPVVYSAFWIVNATFGMDPHAFRVLNVAVHAANVVVVWQIIRALDLRWPLVAASIFAVHPLTVHAVGWAFQLKTTLAAFFFFASILAYLRASREFDRIDRRFYAASLALHVLAQLAKTQAIVLPVIILLILWWRGQAFRGGTLVRLLPFFFVSLVFGLLTIWIQGRVLAPEPVMDESMATRLAAFGWVLGFYLIQTLVPHAQAAIYPLWHIDSSLPADWIPTLTLLVAGLGLLVLSRRSRPARDACFALAVLFASVAPVSGLIDFMYLDISRVSDHFVYMGLFAPIAMAVHYMAKAAEWTERSPHRALFRAFISFAVCTLIFAFAARTHLRAIVYQSDNTVWREAVERYPGNWMAHYHWAACLIDQKRAEEALQELDRAEALAGENAEILLNRANAWWMLGNRGRAADLLERSIERAPWLTAAHRSLAEIEVELGRLADAERSYRRLIALDPRKSEDRQNLGVVLLNRGRPQDAASEFEAILAERPGFESARKGLHVANQMIRMSRSRNSNPFRPSRERDD